MAKNPIFELFETICIELSSRQSSIIAEDDIDVDLIDDLKEEFGDTDSGAAFEHSIEAIEKHLSLKGMTPPFSFDNQTRQFQATDKSYVDFIAGAVSRRGVAKNSRDFEMDILDRLCQRLTGAVHRVGAPRANNKTKNEYAKYLGKLGFDDNALEKKDKDGGFDILWLPPLGAIPLRPIISIQCKNSSFDEKDANSSVSRATRTLNRHSHVRGQHIHFVVFNDYIDDTYIGRAVGWVFVPLGLSDLGSARIPLEKNVL